MTSAESSGNVTQGSSSLEVSVHVKPSSGHRGKMTAWWTCIYQISFEDHPRCDVITLMVLPDSFPRRIMSVMIPCLRLLLCCSHISRKCENLSVPAFIVALYCIIIFHPKKLSETGHHSKHIFQTFNRILNLKQNVKIFMKGSFLFLYHGFSLLL